jgi:Beta-lactamase superfamily domain
MRIEYVCHACLAIDTGDLKIATDPWFQGKAYCGQWSLFPKPTNVCILDDTDVILYSHGHEDHFHPSSLEKLPKTARVFYPFTWYGGVKPYLKEMGFASVTEAPPNKTIRLTPNTSVTYIVNNLDSIMVIESNGQVFVNVNDALHAYPPKIVDVFIELIRQRWPSIDTVFCGFGGASYFPNAIHCPGKNDTEIAEAREQMLAHAFCRIVHDLNPRTAVPFAADFALLRANQRWINERRFPRALIPEYYRACFGEAKNDPRIHVMYPGDVLLDNELLRSSPYRPSTGEPELRVDDQYKDEIISPKHEGQITKEEEDALKRELVKNINLRKDLFDLNILERIQFSLKVPDIGDPQYFNIDMRSAQPCVQRSTVANPQSILEIEIPSTILRHSFASDWGGDAVTIGYGCEIRVFQKETVEANLDVICVQLLTRIPTAGRHWRNEPVRMARYVLSSAISRRWIARAAWNHISRSPASPNADNDKTRTWLFRTKCEVCRACDLPLLDEKFVQTL